MPPSITIRNLRRLDVLELSKELPDGGYQVIHAKASTSKFGVMQPEMIALTTSAALTAFAVWASRKVKSTRIDLDIEETRPDGSSKKARLHIRKGEAEAHDKIDQILRGFDLFSTPEVNDEANK